MREHHDGVAVVDQLVLHLRLVDDLTQSQIAERIGVSQMQVSRLIRRALTRLRTVAESPVGRPPARPRSYARNDPDSGMPVRAAKRPSAKPGAPSALPEFGPPFRASPAS